MIIGQDEMIASWSIMNGTGKQINELMKGYIYDNAVTLTGIARVR